MSIKSKHNQAASIVAQLTLAEKANLCSGKNFWHLEGIERLELQPVMVTDGPHGLRKQNQSADHVGLNKSVPATCFPTACALAATWDIKLIERIGVALGAECSAEDVTVLLGPGLNIKRHPLCGRNFEYFSEDPYLTGQLAAAMVNGVQSQGVGTSIKHFAVNNQEHGRMYIDAIVDDRTLREIYLRGFEIAVRQSQPWTVMCAYNRLNGVYCSEHDELLNKILRDDWGFEGLVVTDWGATNERVAGILGGVDLEMPGSGGANDRLVEEAVKTGALSEAILDKTITRNVALSLLGNDLHAVRSVADHQAHHELAKEAAIASTVLLKNEGSVLPLAAESSIAIIGEFAKRPRYQGTGSSQVNPTQLDAAYDALTDLCPETTYAKGYDAKADDFDQALIDEAVLAATSATYAIVFAGLPSIYESEGFDRPHMNLPKQHDALIQAVAQANPNTVVVLSNGSAVAMPWVDHVPAIVETYLSGQAGGQAIAEILVGMANPGGKLAETFAVSQQDIASDPWFPVAETSPRQVHYREGLHVGYRHFDTAEKEVLFPFGHGLSYTTFTCDTPQLSVSHFEQGSTATLSIGVSNTGHTTGSEVLQLYVHANNSRVHRVAQELKGFVKVQLTPGEHTTVDIAIDDHTFAHWDTTAACWQVESGAYELRIGTSSRDIKATLNIEVRSAHTIHTDGHALDSDFAQLLGRAVPAPEPIRPFHMNSSLQEIGQTWLGARFKARVAASFQANMGGNSSDKTLNKMFEEMANHMPVRALALFSRGEVSIQQLEITLACLNHQYLKAAKLWWRARSS